MNLKKLIENLKLNYVNENITETNFPAPEKLGKDFEIVKYEKTMTTEEVLADLKSKGLRPANIYELLTWTKKNWKPKETEYIAALDSVRRDSCGGRSVPCLWVSGGGGRGLRLLWYDNDWSDYGRFLCVRVQKVFGLPGGS